MESVLHMYNNNKGNPLRAKLYSSHNCGTHSNNFKLFPFSHRKWPSQLAFIFVVVCIIIYCIFHQIHIHLLTASLLENLKNLSMEISHEISKTRLQNLPTSETLLTRKTIASILSSPKVTEENIKYQTLPSAVRDSEPQELCKMPKITPGDKHIYDLDNIQFQTTGRNRPPGCVNNPFTMFAFTMFAIDFDSYLIRLNLNYIFWKTANCSYRPFLRVPDKPDFTFIEGKKIYLLPNEKTKIPPDTDHIHILCKNKNTANITYEDYLSHVPVKPSLEKLLRNRPASLNPKDYPSILILGQDSSSHMNFRRYMPKSHDYLVNTMKALEFNGFNSLGAGTLWSVFPLLSGLDLNDINARCHKLDKSYFDECPWIWKDLEKLGYRTGHCEEEYGTFNTPPSPGFKKQPFHYDFRGVFKKQTSVRIGHNVRFSSKGCYGSRLTFDVLLENSIKVAHTFAKIKKPFFHFTWSFELTHNVNPYSKFGETSMLRSLKQLYEKQLLNNTVLIVISDHGMRYGPLRQSTRQGFLEERLPILYMYIPEALRKRFPTAYKNMEGNVDKLTTAYDVYATMKDLVNLTNLQEDRLLQREKEGHDNRQSVSLFLPVSPRRTCDVIGFTTIYCACMNRTSVSIQEAFVQEAAAKIVASINQKLTLYPICDQLELVKVTSVNQLNPQVSLKDENDRFGPRERITRVIGKSYEIGFETKPGNGMFYASIIKNRDEGALEITDITRVDEYGRDADCMETRDLKAFCHCKKL